MSDLGPVNPLFNAKLKAVREELLPKVISDWHNLDEAERKMGDMGNFFCKLHLLSNFASESDKVLNEFEKLMINEDHEMKTMKRSMHSVQKNPVLFNSSDLHVKHSTSRAVMNVELLHILMLINCKTTLNLSLVIDLIYCFIMQQHYIFTKIASLISSVNFQTLTIC